MTYAVVTVLLVASILLSGCAAVRDTVEAGAACARTERCWR
jgi:uncharacterized protein YceK